MFGQQRLDFWQLEVFWASDVDSILDFVALFSYRQKGAGYEAVLSVILRGFLFLMVGGFSQKVTDILVKVYPSEK